MGERANDVMGKHTNNELSFRKLATFLLRPSCFANNKGIRKLLMSPVTMLKAYFFFNQVIGIAPKVSRFRLGDVYRSKGGNYRAVGALPSSSMTRKLAIHRVV